MTETEIIDARIFAEMRAEQAAQIIAQGFSLNGKVTPITDLAYFIQLAEAGKRIIADPEVSTVTATIASMSGSYEATKEDLNKILAGFETIRSNAVKVELGELNFDDVQAPLEPPWRHPDGMSSTLLTVCPA